MEDRQRRLVCWLLAGGVFAWGGVVLPGCSTTYRERKAKAEAHWSRVRADIKMQLARQQFDHGRAGEAVGFIQEALGWDADNTDAYVLLTKCYLEQGKVAAARRTIEHTATLGANSAEFWSTRATVAERAQCYDDALEYYRRARALDDTVVDYPVAEAECLVALGRPEAARALLVGHLIDYDNDPTIHALLGEVALRMGDESRAAQAFRSVLANGCHDPVIAEEYALLAARRGWHHEALTVLEPMIKRRGDEASPSVIRAAATCMLALDRTEAAKMILRQLLGRAPNDVQAWYLLTEAGIASDDLPTMRLGVAGVRRLAPGNPRTLLVDAYSHLREGNVVPAERALRRLLAADGDDVLAHCLLGVVAERTRDLPAARRHYGRALQLDPACEWARAALVSMES